MRLLAPFAFVAVGYAAITAATSAKADQEYQIVSQTAVACQTQEALASASSQTDALPDRCVRLARGFAYESMDRAEYYWPTAPKGRSIPMIRGRYLATDDNEPSYFHVLASDTAPLTKEDGTPVYPSCEPSSGGEVDRIEVDEGGAIRLRRYLLTYKCVSNRMVGSQRLLNP